MRFFLSLQSLEEDMCKLAQLAAPGASADSMSGASRLRAAVNASLVGCAAPRSGGRAARLLFFCPPRDVITAFFREQGASGGLEEFANPKALWRHRVGYIAGLQIRNSPDGVEHQLPFIPLVTLQRGPDGTM